MNITLAPTSPEWFVAKVLDPGLAWMTEFSGPALATDPVRHLMLTIAMQESGLTTRTQSGGGPAHGWWQFEQGGGVAGVLRHPSSSKLAAQGCLAAVVARDPASCWRAMEGHDGLAVLFARLLLLTDPKQIPTVVDDGWAAYLRLWRPGKPRPGTWHDNWLRAGAEMVK